MKNSHLEKMGIVHNNIFPLFTGPNNSLSMLFNYQVTKCYETSNKIFPLVAHELESFFLYQ